VVLDQSGLEVGCFCLRKSRLVICRHDISDSQQLKII
jgi:hypothetical protein